MLRQLLTMLAVLSGLAAAPVAAEVRSAQPLAQQASNAEVVVIAERVASTGDGHGAAKRLSDVILALSLAPTGAPSVTVRIGIDRAHQ